MAWVAVSSMPLMVPLQVVFAYGIAMLLARAKSGVGLLRTIFYLPALAPPVAATLLGVSALATTGQRPSRMARWWLKLTAVLGFVGVGFHAYGVSRNMGGWRNWKQNVVDGPPLPAPPSFTGLAWAGLAALGLLRDHKDA